MRYSPICKLKKDYMPKRFCTSFKSYSLISFKLLHFRLQKPACQETQSSGFPPWSTRQRSVCGGKQNQAETGWTGGCHRRCHTHTEQRRATTPTSHLCPHFTFLISGHPLHDRLVNFVLLTISGYGQIFFKTPFYHYKSSKLHHQLPINPNFILYY